MATVVVAREFDEFSRRLEADGLTVINCPVIRTEETTDAKRLGSTVPEGNYDGIFVTSAVAAEILAREIFVPGNTFETRVFVLGRKSHAILADKVLRLCFDENANTVQELLEGLSPAELENRRFLFVRGERSLGTIGRFFSGKAVLDEIVVYRTVPVAVSAQMLERITALAANRVIDAFCFFSPSGAESFLNQFDESILRSARVAAIGRTTAEFFEMKGIDVFFTSAKATAAEFADGLLKIGFENRLRAA